MAENKKQGVDYSDLVKNYQIWVDTSSLMAQGSEDFFRNVLPPYLIKYNERYAIDGREKRKIVLIKEVVNELLKMSEDKDGRKNIEQHSKAKTGYEIVRTLVFKEYAVYGGNKPNNTKDTKHAGSNMINIDYADNLFVAKFTEYRLRHKLCLITQDSALSEEILALNTSASSGTTMKGKQTIKGIKVFKINEKKGLEEVFLTAKKAKVLHPSKKTSSLGAKVKKVTEKVMSKPLFSSKAKLIDIAKSKPLTITRIPKSGDEVQYESGKTFYQLGDLIAKGAEGLVYSISGGGQGRSAPSKMVCKIFKKNKLTSHRHNKLKIMIENQINDHGICWPKKILYNSYKEPVGYIMKKAHGNILKTRLLMHPKIFEEQLPGWDRSNLVTVCINILSAINLLHRHNVILGDINGMNIMVTDQCETFIVDTDSFQLEGYPCPVFHPEFTAAEIQKKNFEKFLRKPEHENFSIATLLFMILMCGKSPYAVVDGGMCTQNIQNSQFPYPFDSHGPKGAPPGPWRKIWSHIPYKSKQAFYNCFADNDRIDGIEWKKIMKSYKRYLEMGADDPQSYLIVPDEYKVLSDEVKAKYNKLF